MRRAFHIKGLQFWKRFPLPIDKIPVFIGGKGVIVNRELHGDQLFAEVFPIAKDGSTSRTFHIS